MRWGVRSDHATGTSFSPKGETPVVHGTGQRFGCNMISAISNRGQLYFMIFHEGFRVAVFLEFLRRVIRQAGRKVYLIVDGHPVHRSKKVQQWLEAHAKDIRLFRLPAYSPDLNPDEMLNNDVKSNACGQEARQRPSPTYPQCPWLPEEPTENTRNGPPVFPCKNCPLCSLNHCNLFSELVSNRQDIEDKVSEFANTFRLALGEVKPILFAAWDKAAENAIGDNLLTQEEESRLNELSEFFGMDQSATAQRPVFMKLVKAAVIRDLCEGKIPTRMKVDDLPLSLQKGEQVIWVFKNVKYCENKTRTQFVGGSQGVSVRVMKGVYYRVGAFRGAPIQTTAMVHVDTGLLVVTNTHLTFIGPQKSVRLKHDKIISHTPYSDGIGVCRDAVTAKPQVFITDDGWFTYNVIVNAARL